MKIINILKIILISAVISACQNSKNKAGNSENAKHHSSNNSVNSVLFNENIEFVFTGHSFHIESYLNSSFLAANNISKVDVIQLNERQADNFFSGIPFDTLNAIRLFKLSLNKNGRIVQEIDKGCGEYQSTGDISQLTYNEEYQVQSVETQTQYGNIHIKYSYNAEKKIETIQEYSNGNLDASVHFLNDSITKVTYRLKTPTNVPYSSVKIIKYNGVISDNESLTARKKLIKKLQEKQGPFASDKDLNSSLDIISYKNGLKIKVENWDLKKDSIQSYTDYEYSSSGALIKTSGEHNIWGKYFSHSKNFLYNENGDLINISLVYQKPESMDQGTINFDYEFVYNTNGFLLELIVAEQHGEFKPQNSKVLQFKYF